MPPPPTELIDLLMTAYGMEDDGHALLVFDELEDDPEVEAGTTGPQARKRPFQLVGTQAHVEGILSEPLECVLDVSCHLRSLSDGPLRRSEKGRGGDQPALQEVISLMISSTLAGSHSPAANAARDSRTS